MKFSEEADVMEFRFHRGEINSFYMFRTNILILFVDINGRWNQMENTCWIERNIGQRGEGKNSIKIAYNAQLFTVGNHFEEYLERSSLCLLRHHLGALLFVCFSSIFLHSLAVVLDVKKHKRTEWLSRLKRIKRFIHFIDFGFKTQNSNRF